MRPALRLALVVVSLAAVVYGTASLTGGWLGTPPWWDRQQTWIDIDAVLTPHRRAPLRREDYIYAYAEPRPGREWISGGVVAVGLGLVAVGAWPWRRRPATS